MLETSPVLETVPEAPPVEEKNVSKKRREVTHETVSAEFDAILEMIRESIEQSRSAGSKKPGNIKLLRQLGKRVKVLRADCLRISKQRKNKRKFNPFAGFLKPVNISDEMAKFAGWDPVQLKSRNDATRYICDYIKNNDLQDPTDRRRIKPDNKLSKLLDYTPSQDKPLYYYNIQQKMQRHFKTPEPQTSA